MLVAQVGNWRLTLARVWRDLGALSSDEKYVSRIIEHFFKTRNCLRACKVPYIHCVTCLYDFTCVQVSGCCGYYSYP